ncbi:DUF6207 family protein [Streptomyces sp. NPDC002403]
MEPIHAQYLAKPGLVVLDISAADETTAHAATSRRCVGEERPCRSSQGAGERGTAGGRLVPAAGAITRTRRA